MRAITLYRPWPRAIFELGKDIENRSWAPPPAIIGKRIAIHAGLKIDGAGVAKVMEIENRERAPAFAMDAARCIGEGGAIIGTVLVRAWGEHLVSPWFSGPYGWVLEQPRQLPVPIPCRGRQGLWTVPEEIAERIAYEERRL